MGQPFSYLTILTWSQALGLVRIIPIVSSHVVNYQVKEMAYNIHQPISLLDFFGQFKSHYKLHFLHLSNLSTWQSTNWNVFCFLHIRENFWDKYQAAKKGGEKCCGDTKYTDGKVDTPQEAVFFTLSLHLLVRYKAWKSDCSHFINGLKQKADAIFFYTDINENWLLEKISKALEIWENKTKCKWLFLLVCWLLAGGLKMRCQVVTKPYIYIHWKRGDLGAYITLNMCNSCCSQQNLLHSSIERTAGHLSVTYYRKAYTEDSFSQQYSPKEN